MASQKFCSKAGWGPWQAHYASKFQADLSFMGSNSNSIKDNFGKILFGREVMDHLEEFVKIPDSNTAH